MNSGQQEEFLSSEGNEGRLGLPLADDLLVRDIGVEWGLLVGRRVRVASRAGESFRELTGRLEVAVAPELPLNRHRSLRLRVMNLDTRPSPVAWWSRRAESWRNPFRAPVSLDPNYRQTRCGFTI